MEAIPLRIKLCLVQRIRAPQRRLLIARVKDFGVELTSRMNSSAKGQLDCAITQKADFSHDVAVNDLGHANVAAV